MSSCAFWHKWLGVVLNCKGFNEWLWRQVVRLYLPRSLGGTGLGSWAFLQILSKWNYGCCDGIDSCRWAACRDGSRCCWDITTLLEWRFWIFQFDDPPSCNQKWWAWSPNIWPQGCKACGCHPARDQSLTNYSSASNVAFPFVGKYFKEPIRWRYGMLSAHQTFITGHFITFSTVNALITTIA